MTQAVDKLLAGQQLVDEEQPEEPETTPKPEKKEENVITGITEDRLLELMRQAYTEFWADMIIRLKK